MSNFICHYNNSEKYYDLERVSSLDLSVSLTIILMMDDSPTSPTIETEVFTTAADCKWRLENLLGWAGTNNDQFPS